MATHTTDWTRWLAEQLVVEGDDDWGTLEQAVARVEAMDDAEFSASLEEYQAVRADSLTLEQRLDCGQAEAHEIVREVAERVAAMTGLRCSWSSQSEACYLYGDDDRAIARIACHESGGVSSRAAGHGSARHDIALGAIHATATERLDMPTDMASIIECAEAVCRTVA